MERLAEAVALVPAEKEGHAPRAEVPLAVLDAGEGVELGVRVEVADALDIHLRTGGGDRGGQGGTRERTRCWAPRVCSCLQGRLIHSSLCFWLLPCSHHHELPPASLEREVAEGLRCAPVVLLDKPRVVVVLGVFALYEALARKERAAWAVAQLDEEALDEVHLRRRRSGQEGG